MCGFPLLKNYPPRLQLSPTLHLKNRAYVGKLFAEWCNVKSITITLGANNSLCCRLNLTSQRSIKYSMLRIRRLKHRVLTV